MATLTGNFILFQPESLYFHEYPLYPQHKNSISKINLTITIMLLTIMNANN